MRFIRNDGGRKAAGFKGNAGDCVCRAIAIASGVPYKDVYRRLAEGNGTQRASKRQKRSKAGKVRTARAGIYTQRKWFRDYMRELGFEWTATMTIGSGCRVNLRDGELPMGRLVVNVSRHSAAVIDGVIHDTFDDQRGGARCVYGYWKLLDGWWAGVNRNAMLAWAEQTAEERIKAMESYTKKAGDPGPAVQVVPEAADTNAAHTTGGGAMA
jgi:hypothetical protein